jgi:hypothetical protein
MMNGLDITWIRDGLDVSVGAIASIVTNDKGLGAETDQLPNAGKSALGRLEVRSLLKKFARED